MKVLQILPELNSGGVERGTLEVAEYLIKNGHEALVVSNGGRLVEVLEKMGGRHITMPVHKKSLSTLLQVKAFRALLEKEKPDILHIRSRAPGWVAWLAWRKMDPAKRPRLVSTVHGFYSVNFYSAIMTKGERVIAVSNSIKNYILKNYPKTPEHKITVIHRGVSSEQFPRGYKPEIDWLKQWNNDFPQLEGKVVLLLPGGIDAHGLIVGEIHPKKREFENELRNLAAELKVDAEISFLGHRTDIREVMSVSDLVYSLSLDPEAFGRVSLEAMSIGKPVIAYSHGGVEEQLTAIFPAGLVAVGDVDSVINRTVDILNDTTELGSIEEFRLGKMLSATLGVYNQILNTTRC
jgi:glycosyltransferase involved in cell wall biosynthesis